ncbi:MAG: hypothetical protein H7039_04490 [Bryobacteraceae bacterium]|nr:hypothetical protein [Bryobacteraceae bacterium]
MQAAPWWSLQELRRGATDGTTLGYWTGPDRTSPQAAFLAVTRDGSAVESTVVLDGKTRIVWSAAKLQVSEAGSSRLKSLDLEGVQIRDWAVLFHTESRMARSTLSFDTKASAGPLRFLITGLAPGTWEIWRNGWLVDSNAFVEPREGVLYYSGNPGSYFLRRIT